MAVKVSVIIPTYRHRDFVAQALESVHAQTFNDCEVIVVNDGSPDDTAEVLGPYIDSNRIRYFYQPNGGQAAARNRGLEQAQGELVAFLDDDDLWPLDKLQWQVDFLSQHANVGVVSGRATIIDGAGKTVSSWGPVGPVSFDSLFKGNPILSPGQTLIRRDLLKRIGGFDESIWGADDLDLWFRLARISGVVIEDRCALFYRSHSGNASKQSHRMLINANTVFLKHLRSVPDRAQRRQLRRNAYRHLYVSFGADLLSLWRADARRGKIRKCIAQLRDMRRLAPALADPVLLKRLIRDLAVRSADRIKGPVEMSD